MRSFFLLWSGQLLSLLGTGLTGFALGYWVYQETGSVTRFTLIFVMSALPGVVVAPFAGALVDRWRYRTVLIAADTIPALVTAALAALMATGRLALWHIYLGVGLSSACGIFQWLAFSPVVTMLLSKQHYSRADGLRQFGASAAQMLAPALAGFLMGFIEIWGILLLDVATFFYAFATLTLARIPEPPAGKASNRRSLFRQAVEGWTFIAERPGLKALLWLFANMNLLVGLAFVLVTPLVLSFGSAAVLGQVLSVTSGGLLAGSVLTSAWGGPKDKVHGILGLTVFLGLSLAVAGLRPSVPLIAAGMFLFLAGAAVVNSSSQAIWQSKVPPELQGRVFAMRRMLAQSTTPVAYLLAGPLADRVFVPLMAPGGALADPLGPVIGTGPGRGIGLLFVTMGLLLIVSTAWGYASPRLRRLEEELPDAVVPTTSGAPAEARA